MFVKLENIFAQHRKIQSCALNKDLYFYSNSYAYPQENSEPTHVVLEIASKMCGKIVFHIQTDKIL